MRLEKGLGAARSCNAGRASVDAHGHLRQLDHVAPRLSLKRATTSRPVAGLHGRQVGRAAVDHRRAVVEGLWPQRIDLVAVEDQLGDHRAVTVGIAVDHADGAAGPGRGQRQVGQLRQLVGARIQRHLAQMPDPTRRPIRLLRAAKDSDLLREAGHVEARISRVVPGLEDRIRLQVGQLAGQQQGVLARAGPWR